MGKLLAAVVGLLLLGGFWFLHAKQAAPDLKEQVTLYQENKRARDIARFAYLRGVEHLRKASQTPRLSQQLEGQFKNGSYRVVLAQKSDSTTAVVVTSAYRRSTHEIQATLLAADPSTMTAMNYQEWYDARNR